jgi:electron transport complex protein RnfB
MRCGYADCRSYAEALARHETDVDRCPPGGDATLAALSALLHRPLRSLAPEVGTFAPGTVAVIEEPYCIGCTKCIQACPVDAITGAAKQMHTIIEALCTGCGLCLPPCPVDCIKLETANGLTEGLEGWQFPMAGRERTDALRERYHAFKTRGATPEEPSEEPVQDLKAHHLAEIAAAVARVKARRARDKKV